MAVEQPGFSSSFVSGEDLSAKQYRYVKLDSAGAVVACAGTTDDPVGVLQNSPVAGGEALVMHAGITKMSADAAVAINDRIGTSADAQGAVYIPGTDTTKYINGRALDAAANAGELFTMLFQCLGGGYNG